MIVYDSMICLDLFWFEIKCFLILQTTRNKPTKSLCWTIKGFKQGVWMNHTHAFKKESDTWFMISLWNIKIIKKDKNFWYFFSFFLSNKKSLYKNKHRYLDFQICFHAHVKIITEKHSGFKKTYQNLIWNDA